MAEVKLLRPAALTRKCWNGPSPPPTTPPLPNATRSFRQANGAYGGRASWYEAQVAVDPLGSETADAASCKKSWLSAPVSPHGPRSGRASGREYVPLDPEMVICRVAAIFARSRRGGVLEVSARILARMDNPAFFHPDNLNFGEALPEQAGATAQAVTGVQRRDRQKTPAPFSLCPTGSTTAPRSDSGVLALGSWRWHNSTMIPASPEHGRLKLTPRRWTMNTMGGKSCTCGCCEGTSNA